MRDWNSILDRHAVEFPTDLKVGLGILDISRDIDSEFLRKRTFDMTFYMVNQSCKINLGTYRGYKEKVEDLLNLSLNKGDDICVILCQGMMAFKLHRIVKLTKEYYYKNPDKFVTGHIMHRKDRYPGLHRQLLCVNLKTWAKLGKPEFLECGVFWDRKKSYKNFIVSDDNISLEYTPKFIESDNGFSEYHITEDGSNWVDIALRNNIRIDNLSIPMRECKAFLYPYETTEQLEKVWKDLLNEDEINKLKNYTARAWLRKLSYQEKVDKDRVYVFNTEGVNVEGRRSAEPVDHLFSAAAGFKPLALLKNNGFHKDTVVHYFDWCSSSLDFKKHLLETWDGEDLDKWLLNHDLKYNFCSTYRGNFKEYWDLELSEFGSRDEFKMLWNRYRKLDHRYHIIDLVTEPERLFDVVDSCRGTKILWATNIWNSMQLHWHLDPEIIEEKYLYFESLIADDLVLYGEDYLGIDLHERIRNKKRSTHPRYKTESKYLNMDRQDG